MDSIMNNIMNNIIMIIMVIINRMGMIITMSRIMIIMEIMIIMGRIMISKMLKTIFTIMISKIIIIKMNKTNKLIIFDKFKFKAKSINLPQKIGYVVIPNLLKITPQ